MREGKISKKDKIEKVIHLFENTPDGVVVDSDTILKDLCDQCNMEENGLSLDIFRTWNNAKTEQERKAIEGVFLIFTGTEFSEYVERCLAETTRKKE